MKIISNYVKELLKTGINTDTKQKEIFKVKLFNEVVLLSLFVGILFVLFSLINSFYQVAAIAAFITAFISCSIFLNKKLKYDLAVINFLTFATVGITVAYIAYGSSISFIMLYVILCFYSIILFHQNIYKLITVTAITMIYIGLSLYTDQFPTLIPLNTSSQAIANFILGALAFSFLTRTFLNNYSQVLSSSESNIDNLTKLNKELAESKKAQKLINIRLDEKNKELEQFAFIASHDLKSPVRNILSFISLFEKKILQKDFYNMTEYIEIIKLSGNKMNELVDSILTFSRVKKFDELKSEEIDMNKMISYMIETINLNPKRKNADFNIDWLPIISGNRIQIEQLFNNLIENGIKYNLSKMPCINIFVEYHKSAFTIKVKDNGIGISKEYHSKIFEMFKRLHSNNEYKGTGIGLAICKKITENHNGEMSLDSVPDKGSCFNITFPNKMLKNKNTENLVSQEISL